VELLARSFYSDESALAMMARSNVLRFSCRRGALNKTSSKKQRSRAPKAVRCKRLLDGGVEMRIEP